MPLAVLASSNFTDPEHEQLIWLAVGGLVLLGVLLLVVTVVWWRGTKGEHAALAPLEVMGDRSFAGLTHVEQSRRLDAVRLQLDGDVEPDAVVAEDAVDLDEVLRSFQPGFDDLRDERAAAPAAAADAPAATPRIAVAVVGAASDEAPGPVTDGLEPQMPVTAAADQSVAGVTDLESADDGPEASASFGGSDGDAVTADGDGAAAPAEAEIPGGDATTGEVAATTGDSETATEEPARPTGRRGAATTGPSETAGDGRAVEPDAAGDRHRNGVGPSDVAPRDADGGSSGNGTEVRSIDPLLTGEPVES